MKESNELTEFLALVAQKVSLLYNEEDFVKAIQVENVNLNSLENQFQLILCSKFINPSVHIQARKNYINCLDMVIKYCTNKKAQLEYESAGHKNEPSESKDPEDVADAFFDKNYKIYVNEFTKRVVLDKDDNFAKSGMLNADKKVYETCDLNKAKSAFKDFCGEYPGFTAVTNVLF